jgi:hypothetical protein
MPVSRLVALVAGVSIMAIGCAPGVSSTRFSEVAPHPADHEIRLYSTLVPECPYEELGLVSGKAKVPWTSGDAVLASVRDRARAMGGDAIVGLGQVRRVTGGTAVGESVSLDTTTELSGTVVRFTDPECRR